MLSRASSSARVSTTCWRSAFGDRDAHLAQGAPHAVDGEGRGEEAEEELLGRLGADLLIAGRKHLGAECAAAGARDQHRGRHTAAVTACAACGPEERGSEVLEANALSGTSSTYERTMPSSWPRVTEARSESSGSLRFCASSESCSLAGGSESGGCNAAFLSFQRMDEQDPEPSNAASRTTAGLSAPTQHSCNSPRSEVPASSRTLGT